MNRLRIYALALVLLMACGLVGPLLACAEAPTGTKTVVVASDTAGVSPDGQAEAGEEAPVAAEAEVGEDATAVAAEPEAGGAAAVAVDENDARPVLYLVLADCGTTLYGAEPFNGSLVNRTGDPDGMLLSLIAAAPPLLFPQANIAVFGYHSELIAADVDVAPMGDSDAVDGQVTALLNIPEVQRQSSNLAAALTRLGEDVITGRGLTEQYDCRLVILTGGAQNFAKGNASVESSDGVRSALDSLRTMGVTIRAFGFDLRDSGVLNPLANADALLLDDSLFAAGEYTAVLPQAAAADLESARLTYAVAVLDYFAEEGGYGPSALADAVGADAMEGEEVYILWNEADHRFQGLRAGVSRGLSPMTTLQGASLVRSCAPATEDEAVEEAPQPDAVEVALEAVRSALDRNGDGALDVSTLQAGEEREWPCPGISGFIVTSDNPGVLQAQADGDRLVLTPKGSGEATLAISAADDPDKAIQVSATVRDYRLKWSIQDGTVVAPKQAGVELVSCVDGELGFLLERQDNGGAWTEITAGDAGLTQSGNALGGAPAKPGNYRLTAWVEADEETYNQETRALGVKLELDPVEAVALKTPYFKEQAGQRVALTADGEVAPIEGCVASAEPAGLADVYLDAGAGCLYLVPKAAGTGVVTLADADGGELLSFELKVSRLTGQPLLWVLAVALPICLIGLTVMAVLLILKVKNR